MKEEPEGCKDCTRDQCPVHCVHLVARLEAKGISPTSSAAPAQKTQVAVPMQGTY